MKQITIDNIVYNCTPVDEQSKKKPQILKEERFKQLIEGIDVNRPMVNFEKYPDSIFWSKGEECLFEYDFKTREFWCNYSLVWSIFEAEYSMYYEDIQSFIRVLVEEHFKIKGVTPKWQNKRVEEHFKMK